MEQKREGTEAGAAMKGHHPLPGPTSFLFRHPLITLTSNSFPEKTPYLGVILQLWHLTAAFFPPHLLVRSPASCQVGSLPESDVWLGEVGGPQLPCPSLCVLPVFGSAVGGLRRVSI